jgi:hypothetical protein
MGYTTMTHIIASPSVAYGHMYYSTHMPNNRVETC